MVENKRFQLNKLVEYKEGKQVEMEDKATLQKRFTQSKSLITFELFMKSIDFLKQRHLLFKEVLEVGYQQVILLAQRVDNQQKLKISLYKTDGEEMSNSLAERCQQLIEVNSPHVIKYISSLNDEENKCFYMITQFSPEMNLRDYCKQHGDLSALQISDIFRGILQGIMAIHEKNIIYGDLISDHILISDALPKICDLGLSESIPEEVGGYIAYKALDQLEGRDVIQSDYYSAGAILCFLCGLTFEDSSLRVSQYKCGQFENIKGHKFEELLKHAFSMMNPSWQLRSSPQEIFSLLSNIPLIPERNEGQETRLNDQGYKMVLAKRYDNGDKYEGQFKNNLRNGYGTLSFKDGRKYMGEFKDEEECGKGTSFSKEGIIEYAGDWAHGMKNGEGIIFFNQGDRYKGSFKDDRREGKGEMIEKSWGRYKGEWISGQKNGFGRFHFDNGDIHEGFYFEDDSDGKGTLTFSDGRRIEGNFSRKSSCASGKLYFPNGDTYEGNFKGNKMCGDGTFYFQDGKRLEGLFPSGREYGYGKIYFLNGDTYEGQFKDNQMSGDGILFLRNQDKFVGKFKDGKKNGPGTLFGNSNNKLNKGYWQDDNLSYGCTIM